jgi:tRNA pseudouridine32 synthase/23S rRNA pseudouridine746 synthase
MLTTDSKIFHKTISLPDDPPVLCDALSVLSGLSKTKIKEALNKGAVWIQQGSGKKNRIRRATARLREGDRIWLYYAPIILAHQSPVPSCIQDYKDYSIWFKPAGQMSQGTHFGDHCALPRWVETWFKPRRKVYPVHRLDREAAGLLILAHHRRTAARLSSLFRTHQIEKHYQARLRGDLRQLSPKGVIELPLDNQRAITSYEVKQYNEANDISTVLVQIQTGRYHQIRRHFDLIGHPVMGDPKYGKHNSYKEGMQLIAFAVRFKCPFGHGNIDVSIDPNLVGASHCQVR